MLNATDRARISSATAFAAARAWSKATSGEGKEPSGYWPAIVAAEVGGGRGRELGHELRELGYLEGPGEAVVLTADASLDLRANPTQDAQGLVVEAQQVITHLGELGAVAIVGQHGSTLGNPAPRRDRGGDRITGAALLADLDACAAAGTAAGATRTLLTTQRLALRALGLTEAVSSNSPS